MNVTTSLKIQQHIDIYQGKRRAIIIGVSDYEDKSLRALDFCRNDAAKMLEILEKLGYEIADNHKLIGHVKYDVMREAIYDFFDNKKSGAEDTLLFYYSGHGIPTSRGNTVVASSEIDHDAPNRKGFSSYELTNLIQDSVAIRIVEILDCCYSGSAKVGKGFEELGKGLDKGSAEDAAATLGTEAIENNAKMLREQGEGKCLLAASQAAQEAYGLKEKGHSIFTYYLLEGLNQNKKSIDSNGIVTPYTLGNYIYREIMSLPENKRPRQKPIIKAEAVGDIILAYYPELAKQKIGPSSQKDNLLQLLKEGKIDEFNEIRRKDNYSRLNFYKVDLNQNDLSHADLRNVDLNLANLIEAKLHYTIFEEASLLRALLIHSQLPDAKLSNADLTHADLSNANLTRADLSNANLTRADLTHADLSFAKLSNADLSFAKLSNADLSFAKLSNADLTRADLSSANLSDAYLAASIIIGVNFPDNEKHYPRCKYADFGNTAIIDEEKWCRYFRYNNAKEVPPAIKDKKKLRKKLEKRGFDTITINKYLSFSSLQEPTGKTRLRNKQEDNDKIKHYTSGGKPVYKKKR